MKTLNITPELMPIEAAIQATNQDFSKWLYSYLLNYGSFKKFYINAIYTIYFINHFDKKYRYNFIEFNNNLVKWLDCMHFAYEVYDDKIKIESHF